MHLLRAPYRCVLLLFLAFTCLFQPCLPSHSDPLDPFTSFGTTGAASAQTPFWLDTRANVLRVQLNDLLVFPRPNPSPAYTIQKLAMPSPQLVVTFPGASLSPALPARAFQLAAEANPSFGPVQLEQLQLPNQRLVTMRVPFRSAQALEQVKLSPGASQFLSIELPDGLLDTRVVAAADSFWQKVFSRHREQNETDTTEPKVKPPVAEKKEDQKASNASAPVGGNASNGGSGKAEAKQQQAVAVLESFTLDGETVWLNNTSAAPLRLLRQFSLSNPNRLVFDFSPVRLEDKALSKSLSNLTSGVRNLRLGQFEQDVVRLVLEPEGGMAYHVGYGPRLQDPVSLFPYPPRGAEYQETLRRQRWALEKQPLPPNQTSPLRPVGLAGVAASEQTGSGGKTYINLTGAGPLDYWIHHDDKKLMVELFNVPAPAQPIYFDTQQLSDVKRLVHQRSPLTGEQGSQLLIETREAAAAFSFEAKPDHGQLLLSFAPQPSVIINRTGEESKQTHPIGKALVVVDAGHGGKDQGASRSGILEKDLNLQMALKVRDALAAKGLTVKMTRSDDVFLPLATISNIANAAKPDVFVSIHHNASNSPAINGLETYYYTSHSIPLAQAVHAQLKSIGGIKDNGVRKAMFYVIHHTKAPAILCEMGYVSNPAELNRLANPAIQKQQAEAIAQGIVNYLKTR